MQSSVKLDMISFNATISVCGKGGEWQKAVTCLFNLKEGNKGVISPLRALYKAHKGLVRPLGALL